MPSANRLQNMFLIPMWVQTFLHDVSNNRNVDIKLSTHDAFLE